MKKYLFIYSSFTALLLALSTMAHYQGFFGFSLFAVFMSCLTTLLILKEYTTMQHFQHLDELGIDWKNYFLDHPEALQHENINDWIPENDNNN